MNRETPLPPRRPLAVLTAMLLSGLYAGNAAAQLEEVVVTAQKREQSVQDIAGTVNALSGTTLDEFQVLDFEQLSELTPGLDLQANDARNFAITMRGVQDDPDNTATGTIRTYWNEINVRPAVAFKPMYDIERVEVLRGPQGTLQGHTSPAGAINIYTRRANLSEYDGYIRQVFGDNDASNTQFGASIPIIDNTLGIRISGLYDETDGQEIENVKNGDEESQRNKAGRLSVGWVPLDNLEFNLTYDYRENDAVLPDPLDGTLTFEGTEFDQEDREANAVQEYSQFDRQELTALNISWDLGSVTLTSVSGYQETLNVNTQDQAKSGLFNASVPQHVWTPYKDIDQEIRVQNNDPGNWEYTVGIYYNQADVLSIADLDPRAFGVPLLTMEIPITSETTAIYNHNTIHITDVDHLDVGLRFQHNSYRSEANVYYNGVFFEDALGDYDNTSEDAWTGKLAYTRDLSDETMAYISYDRGYRAPGVTIVLGTPPGDRLPFDEETSDSIELGMKSTLLEGRLRINGVIFYQEYDGYQARATNLSWQPTEEGPVENIAGVTYNADTTVQGVELEFAHMVSDRFTWAGGASYNDSSIDDGETRPCTDLSVVGDLGDCDASGDAVAPIPDWSLTVSGDYVLPLNTTELYLRGLYKWQSEVEDAAVEDDKIDSYGVLNLFAGIRSADGRWDVGVWGRNVTDEQSLAFLQPNLFLGAGLDTGVNVARMIPQRTYGVSVQYNWGL